MANDPKSSKLTKHQALHGLYKGLDDITKEIKAFEDRCVALRKAETARLDQAEALAKAEAEKAKKLEKKSPPGRKEEVEKLKEKGLPASEAFGIAWDQYNDKHKKAEKPLQKVMSPVIAARMAANKAKAKAAALAAAPKPAPAAPVQKMDNGPTTVNATSMSGGTDAMAMSAKPMYKDDFIGQNPTGMQQSEGSMACSEDHMCKCENCSKLDSYARSMHKGEVPASAAPEYPGEEHKKVPAPKETGNDEGSGDKAGLEKAALNVGAPKPPAMPKPPGLTPGTTLTGHAGAVPGVGHKIPKPAAVKQTMIERVASKMGAPKVK